MNDVITSGFKCSACYSPCDGTFELPHKENKEVHLMHEKCQKIWNENQKLNPTCPWCYPPVSVLETPSQELVEYAKRGHIDNVKNLMEDSLKKSTLPISYHVAVFKAAEFGHANIVKYLLSKGNIYNEFCGMAVLKATENGHSEVLETLLYNRNNPWESIPRSYLNKSLEIAKKNLETANSFKKVNTSSTLEQIKWSTVEKTLESVLQKK